MTSARLSFFFSCLLCFFSCFSLLASSSLYPVLYKGRFRPPDAYARLWLQDVYHAQALKKEDLAAFHLETSSALDFLWQLEAKGHQPFIHAPLFWIQSADIKRLARLDLLRNRFSYQELTQALYVDPESSQSIFNLLATYHFLQSYFDASNRSRAERIELVKLLPGLWVQWKENDLKVAALPPSAPWPFLQVGQQLAANIRPSSLEWLKQNKKIAEDLSTLTGSLLQFESLSSPPFQAEQAYIKLFDTLHSQQVPPKQIASILEKEYPLLQRLKAAGPLFKALPASQSEEWYSLQALNTQVYSKEQNRLLPIGNFTSFSNEDFERIRDSYLAWERALLDGADGSASQLFYERLASALETAFTSLAGQPYREAANKMLVYPSLNQLKAESLYYHYPWIKILILLYGLSAVLLIFAHRFPSPSFFHISGIGVLMTAFICHFFLLLWRCYILSRPPVSNMFETVIYVPWIAVLGALILNQWRRNALLLAAASLTAIILLTLLDLTDLNHSLDQVQAVLDSQFWLIIHVLMVVGSYGIFILGAVLGHFYLGSYLYYRQETPLMKLLAQLILQTMYMGTALLIPGTILGGVWAAESWGRFWDWDPKESWAFISSCLYLIWIHAYRFHCIANFGLAFGAVSGLLAISFTWYGVNYILGTGLHSYGFGIGGEGYYYAFIVAEMLFLLSALGVYFFNRQLFFKEEGK